MKRIVVIVSPRGESRIETYGYHGNSYRAATRSLEKALGIRDTETLKPEAYENQITIVEQKENE